MTSISFSKAQGRRVVLDGKAGKALEDLEGKDRMLEIERRAQAAYPNLSPKNALEFYLRTHAAEAVLYRQAGTAESEARGAKRASVGDRLSAMLSDRSLESARLVAELVELDRGPSQAEVYAEHVVEALRGAPAGATKAEAFGRFYKAHREEWFRYAAARRFDNKAHVVFAERLYDDLPAPIVKGLGLDNVPEREARAIAWAALPGLASARRHAIAMARAGASVAQLEHGHAARVEMVRRLAIMVLGRKRNAGPAVTFGKCLETTLVGDVGLRRELAGPNEEGADA